MKAKKIKSLYLDKELLARIEAKAKEEKRSFCNISERLLEKGLIAELDEKVKQVARVY